MSGEVIQVTTNPLDIEVNVGRTDITVCPGESVQVNATNTSVDVFNPTEQINVKNQSTNIDIQPQTPIINIEAASIQGPPGPASGSSFGWVFIRDDTTFVSGFSLDAETTTFVPISSDFIVRDELQTPFTMHEFFNTEGRFCPRALGDSYLIRINVGLTALIADAYLGLEFVTQLSGQEVVIYSNLERFGVNAGDEDFITFNLPIFVGAIFDKAELRFTSHVPAIINSLNAFIIPQYAAP